MNTKRIFTALFMIITAVVFQSCSINNDKLNGTASVQLKLVDAPGDYLEVNVNIVDIQYNNTDNDSGWTSFNLDNTPISVDLTKLVAGNNLILADQLIPAGTFKQIRLILSDGNTLKIEGNDTLIPLDTPSAMQSGLKLHLNDTLQAGFSYTFILDWDVQKSIVKDGASGKYNLKPVIRVNAEVNSGSISGNVVENIDTVETPVQGAIVEFVNQSDATIEGSTSTDEKGNYLIQGIPAGTYTLTIQHTGYDDVTISDVNVTAGAVTTVDKTTLNLTSTP